jgi:hypothetical protein
MQNGIDGVRQIAIRPFVVTSNSFASNSGELATSLMAEQKQPDCRR